MNGQVVRVAAAVLLIGNASAAYAQDTRPVVEPRFPPTCVTLLAQLPGTLAADHETRLDTVRIQQAIDRCAPGQAVELRADEGRTSFLTGPISLSRGVTLLVGAGTTLFASRDPRAYDVEPGSCGVVTRKNGRGCKPLIQAQNAAGAGVMGPGVIDGRGGSPLLGRAASWWDLAQEAKVSGGYQHCPRLIAVERSDDFRLYRIMLRNAPHFHVSYSRGNGFTAWGVVIDTPNSARNTDGIDPSSSTNVTIAHSFIRTGDDNIAIKAGGNGPSSNITVADNQFYGGHGMSIGSETNGGVRNVLVTGLSIDGADNGLRIKSNTGRGGLVSHIVYEDICIRRTRNAIVMDTSYTADPDDEAGRLLPHFTAITLKRVSRFASFPTR